MPMARSKASVALLKRASKINGLIDKNTHPQVSLALQRSYGGLAASAQMLPLLHRVGVAYVGKATRPSKRSSVEQLRIAFRITNLKNRYDQLMVEAELMGAGRDIEVYKSLG